jgi:hypothetical protein
LDIAGFAGFTAFAGFTENEDWAGWADNGLTVLFLPVLALTSRLILDFIEDRKNPLRAS